MASTSRQPAKSAGKTTLATGRDEAVRGERLARLTAYWAGEGDYYTGRCLSSTGIHLHDGHCAVDPSIIPYGSVVEIAGVGKYLAVDTGSAVISRTAAREAAHNAEERSALVIDLFFESRRDGESFAANGPKYAAITWQAPRTADNATKESIGLIAEENWNRLPSKQL
jgi:3D (Asp-Asp-Asp) domain-containing protein